MSQNYRNKPKIILKNKAVFRKSDKTRQAILDAALEYLWEHSYRDLTIRELMSLAGSSRSAFYRYYEDLPAMMEQLLNELEERILAVAAAWFSGEGDPILMLRKSLGDMLGVCYQYGPIVRAVMDAAPTNEQLEKAWKSFASNFDNAVTQEIKRQQSEGLIKSFDTQTVAMALNRMNAEMVRYHFGHRPPTDQKIVRDAIIRVWVATLYGDNALDSYFPEEKTSINLK